MNTKKLLKAIQSTERHVAAITANLASLKSAVENMQVAKQAIGNAASPAPKTSRAAKAASKAAAAKPASTSVKPASAKPAAAKPEGAKKSSRKSAAK